MSLKAKCYLPRIDKSVEAQGQDALNMKQSVHHALLHRLRNVHVESEHFIETLSSSNTLPVICFKEYFPSLSIANNKSAFKLE